ncbi:TfoX/Sxy family protein [Faecalibaculum rodentium]|uniref:TfoX/Sxy family protein n=1 Tax=Faecalibaculum rodentium TaxID=1702221 RepID=UPI0023F1FE94|nr:competence protein TfoX [Faecalibaculum rodentium]
MASSREFVNYVREQLSGRDDVVIRPMMGEYLVYWGGKVGGDICDNRLLVKPVPSALRLLPDASLEPPYPGAKDMILVEDLEDRSFLTSLMDAMEPELPARKKRTPKKKPA